MKMLMNVDGPGCFRCFVPSKYLNEDTYQDEIERLEDEQKDVVEKPFR